MYVVGCCHGLLGHCSFPRHKTLSRWAFNCPLYGITSLNSLRLGPSGSFILSQKGKVKSIGINHFRLCDIIDFVMLIYMTSPLIHIYMTFLILGYIYIYIDIYIIYYALHPTSLHRLEWCSKCVNVPDDSTHQVSEMCPQPQPPATQHSPHT